MHEGTLDGMAFNRGQWSPWNSNPFKGGCLKWSLFGEDHSISTLLVDLKPLDRPFGCKVLNLQCNRKFWASSFFNFEFFARNLCFSFRTAWESALIPAVLDLELGLQLSDGGTVFVGGNFENVQINEKLLERIIRSTKWKSQFD